MLPSLLGTRARKLAAALVITAAGAAGISSFEGGDRTTAYIPIKGDRPTIGVGATYYENGTAVKLEDKITKAQSQRLFQHHLTTYSNVVVKCANVPMFEYEFEVYTSLALNVGSDSFCYSSIPIKLKKYDYLAACKTILEFNKMRDCSKPKVYNVKKQKWECALIVVKGLDNRRKQEYKICIGEKTWESLGLSKPVLAGLTGK